MPPTGVRDKRSVSLLRSALVEAKLASHDVDSAVQFLASANPEFARMKRHAQMMLATKSLAEAIKATPQKNINGDPIFTPFEVVKSHPPASIFDIPSPSLHSLSRSLTPGPIEFQVPTRQETDKIDKRTPSRKNSRQNLQGLNSNDMLPYVKSPALTNGNDLLNTNATPQAKPDIDQEKADTSSRKRSRDWRRLSSLEKSTHLPKKRSAECIGPLQQRPNTRYSDIGGIQNVLENVKELIEWPLLHVNVYSHLGVDPPRGILLHGPSGCGKTLLAHAIAGELGVPFFKVAAPEIVSGMSGESEKRLRDLFHEAKEAAPSIIFIDEIDAISSRRENANKDMERRIVAQLLACMDDISLQNTQGNSIVVIGATNRPDALEPALRRAGRFDRELELGAPDQEAREMILRALSTKLRLSGAFDFRNLARNTAGYVGADLANLTTMAATVAVRRIRYLSESTADKEDAMNVETDIADLFITMDDFMNALPKVQPSALREGFATVPDVSWEDVGALEEVRAELMMAVVQPIRVPERFVSLGLSAPAGVLLYGPPGCGKTLLAKAVAKESGANFLSVKGPELLNKYVGESERSVRLLFHRARSSAPCVIFFDELDALAPRRGRGSSGDSVASERVVNQLLTELDGMDTRRQVFVIAATNRPDIIDPAMLRPGRLDKLLYVPLPSAEERYAILQASVTKTPLAPDIDLKAVAFSKKCEGFSGADIVALVREAAFDKLRNLPPELDPNAPIHLSQENFNVALQRVFPSVSARDARLYQNLQHSLRKSRAHIVDEEENGGTSGNRTTGT